MYNHVFYSAFFSSSKVYSLNAKGLNVPEKSSIVLAEAHRHRAQNVFLQETHFKVGSFPEVYHATCADSKTKGVSILLAKSFMFPLTDQMLDAEGRFLFLKGT